MPWTPPNPPFANRESIVAYWNAILEIPLSEPGAGMLRDMASHRLMELGVVFADEPTEPIPPVHRQ
jgi:hypothetical protein